MENQPRNTGGRGRGRGGVDDGGSGRGGGSQGVQGTPTRNRQPAEQEDDRGNKRPNEEYTSPGDTRQERRQRVEPEEPADPVKFARVSAAERAKVLKEQRDKLIESLTSPLKGVKGHKTRLLVQEKRLFVVPLKDPNSPDINYGHRKWPLPLSSVESVDDFISSIMAYVWNEHYNWKDDPLHAARCRRLVDEFQRTGLPQTVHADLQDELELHPINHRSQKIAFRCPCWEECLGYEWFNHSDASLIESIGPGWGTENQHLFLHLLTRMLMGMTFRYMRDAPEYMDNNPPRPEAPHPKRMKDWWPVGCKAIFEKIREIKGSKPSNGVNWTISSEGYRLIGTLTGLPKREILDKMNYKRKIKNFVPPGEGEATDERASASAPATGGGPLPPDQTGLPVHREKPAAKVAVGGRRPTPYFSPEHKNIWETYLLTQRMINPKFRKADIDKGKLKELMILMKKEHEEKTFKAKLNSVTEKLLYNTTSNHRAARLQVQAVRAYNQLAQAKEGPPYDPLNPNSNNKEWCGSAAKLVISLELNRRNRVETGEVPPTDYDAREQAGLIEVQAQETLEDITTTEPIQMNVATERSRGDQILAVAPLRTVEQRQGAIEETSEEEFDRLMMGPAMQIAVVPPPAVEQRQGAVEETSDEEFDRLIMGHAMQISRQTLAAQYGRQVDEPVVFKVPADRPPRQQGPDRDRQKGPAPASSSSDSDSDGGVVGVGSSHPSGLPRTPSPPPMGTSSHPDHTDVIIMDSDPVLQGLFVGPSSAASAAEGLLDFYLNSEDKSMQNLPGVQSFMDLMRTPSPVRPTQVEPVQPSSEHVSRQMDAREMELVDTVINSIQATEQQLRRSLSPPAQGSPGATGIPAGMPDQGGPSPPRGGGGGSPGGGGGGGSPGGGAPTGSPGWPYAGPGGDGGGGGGGGDPDDDLMNENINTAARYTFMYDYVSITNPDVNQFIKWPSRMVEFNRWVLLRWPSMYFNIRWPRRIPPFPPGLINQQIDEVLAGA